MDRVSSTGLTSANEGNDPVVTARAGRERHVSRIRRPILTIRCVPPFPPPRSPFLYDLPSPSSRWKRFDLRSLSSWKPVNRRGVNREVFKLLINSGNCVERWNVVSLLSVPATVYCNAFYFSPI